MHACTGMPPAEVRTKRSGSDPDRHRSFSESLMVNLKFRINYFNFPVNIKRMLTRRFLPGPEAPDRYRICVTILASVLAVLFASPLVFYLASEGGFVTYP